ncbi:peptide chain release factor 1 [candidate division WOR-3 bacterium]|nr:peptide chain release factor 1 [candidate division WOR-3 bacterium]
MQFEQVDLTGFIEKYKTKHRSITQEISDPLVFQDQKKYLKLLREKSEIDPIIELDHEIEILKNKLIDIESVISTEDEPEMVELAENEKFEIEQAIKQKNEKMALYLLPKDPLDSKNIIVEIRPAAGGEEAALFAQDMFRMYQRYSELNFWKFDLIDMNKTELGGIKECVFSITGKNVFKKMRFESGVHRVQRVPATESGGRIHTSTITIAILPEPEEVDIQIDPKDIKMDFFHSSGPGGQNVNKLSTAVRLTYIPTGLAVVCQDERSQLKNREKAYKVLKARLYDSKLKEETAKISNQRKSQVGTGDRSERIRTYNYPQKRVTDHRINFSIHRLEEILDGNLDLIVSPLIQNEFKNRIIASGL